MANTYTQLHIQVVFSPKYRAAMISASWKTQLHKYISGIIKAQGHQLLAINAMPDHVHIFFGMRPHQAISALMQEVKGSSSGWINEQRLTRSPFKWQEGYGAFSYKKNDAQTIINYVNTQEQHHLTESFLDEHRRMLTEFEIDYDEEYLLRDPE